jgi:hypothetical protein
MLGFGGRRLTRSLSKSSASDSGSGSLAGDHRQLLVKLMSRGLEARSSSEHQRGCGLEGAGAAGAGSGLPPRADPLKRTRSSIGSGRRSAEVEREVAHIVAQQALAAQQAQAQAQQAAATAANGGFVVPRPPSQQQQQQQQLHLGAQLLAGAGSGRGARGGFAALPSGSLSAPLIEPNMLFGTGLSDVLVTPSFSSQEIALLIDALKPKP